MSISMACQECGRLLRVKDELAGKRIKCPHCSTVQAVPCDAAVAEPPQPAPRQEPAETPEALLAQHTTRKKWGRLLRLAALIGFLYGLVSAFGNQNPYYSWFSPGASSMARLDLACQWKPSPLWLPSYVLCSLLIDGRNGIGVYYDRAGGYHMKSFGGWIAYYEASSLLGALMGAGLIVGALVMMRLIGYVQPPLQLPTFRGILSALGWGFLSLISGWICMIVVGAIACIGARNQVEMDARALPVGLNAFLFGLAIPTLVRSWRNQ